MPTTNPKILSGALAKFKCGDLQLIMVEGEKRPGASGYPINDSKVWDVVIQFGTDPNTYHPSQLNIDLLLDVIRGQLAANGYSFKPDYKVYHVVDERTLPISKTKLDGSVADVHEVQNIIDNALQEFEWVVYPKAAKIHQKERMKNKHKVDNAALTRS